MLKIKAIVIMAAMIAISCLGCAQDNGVEKASLLERSWGRSFESARTNQILNPEASENLEPVEGIEGQVAERTYNEHVSGKTGKKKSSTEFGVLTFKK